MRRDFLASGPGHGSLAASMGRETGSAGRREDDGQSCTKGEEHDTGWCATQAVRRNRTGATQRQGIRVPAVGEATWPW